MSDIFSRNFERQVARCQSEHPDIYDAHYDAIEQWKVAQARSSRWELKRADDPKE